MPLHVQGEVVAAREGTGTQVTLERFGPRVLAVMPGQLVGSGKLPAAALPRALVRLLARVGPLVGFEVGALGVDLVTSWKVTVVDFAPLQTLGVICVTFVNVAS